MRGLLLSAVSLAAVAGVGMSAPARADDHQDYVFYSSIGNGGMTITNPPGLRAQGQQVCVQLDAGWPWRRTVTQLMNLGYPLKDAAQIFVSAVEAYCPSQQAVADEATAAANNGGLLHAT